MLPEVQELDAIFFFSTFIIGLKAHFSDSQKRQNDSREFKQSYFT